MDKNEWVLVRGSCLIWYEYRSPEFVCKVDLEKLLLVEGVEKTRFRRV